MNTFMNKTDLQKLTMLKQIFIIPTTCTLTELATFLGVSTRTVTRYFSELQHDCIQLFSTSEFSLEKSDGIISYKISSDLSSHHILDHLQVTYTMASTEFQIIHALLMKRYTTINELADELFLSPSSLYRLLYKLEPIIQKFDLDFAFMDKQNRVNFIYEEKKLRLFSYYFYWTTLKGLQPDITNLGSQTIEQIDAQIDWQNFSNWLPSKKEQLRYAWTVTTIRQGVKGQLTAIPDDVTEILTVFTEVNDLSSLYKPFKALPKEDSERLFSNFFLRVTSAKLDSTTQIMEIVTKLHELDSLYTQRTHNFLESINIEFKLELSVEQYAYFYYQFMLTLLFIFYGEVELPQEFKEIDNLRIFNQPHEDYTESLLFKAQNYYSQSALPEYIPEKHKQTLLGFICVMLDSKERKPLKLSIHYSKNIMGETLIQQNLSLLFSEKSISFTQEMNEADIIIADCYITPSKNKEYFYIDSLTDQLRWDSLYKFIKQQIIDNFFKFT